MMMKAQIFQASHFDLKLIEVTRKFLAGFTRFRSQKFCISMFGKLAHQASKYNFPDQIIMFVVSSKE